MTHADAAAFFDQFGTLFADDGRADAWVGSTQGEGLIVLDRDDVLYAYGPLDEFERMLRDRGFAAGFPLLPNPHIHNYNPELSPEEARLREWSRWNRVLPLDEDDEVFVPLSAIRDELGHGDENVVASVVGSQLRLICPTCSTPALRDWAALYGIGRSEAICAECGQVMTFLIPSTDSLGASRRCPSRSGTRREDISAGGGHDAARDLRPGRARLGAP